MHLIKVICVEGEVMDQARLCLVNLSWLQMDIMSMSNYTIKPLSRHLLFNELLLPQFQHFYYSNRIFLKQDFNQVSYHLRVKSIRIKHGTFISLKPMTLIGLLIIQVKGRRNKIQEFHLPKMETCLTGCWKYVI